MNYESDNSGWAQPLPWLTWTTETPEIRVEKLFSFLHQMLDLKHLYEVTNQRLTYYAKTALPAWYAAVFKCCKETVYKSLVSKRKRILEMYMKELGLPGNCDIPEIVQFNQDMVRAELIAKSLTLKLKEAVHLAQAVIHAVQTTCLLPYFRNVDEFVDSVLGVIRRVITNEAAPEPMFAHAELNAIVSHFERTHILKIKQSTQCSGWDAAIAIKQVIPLSDTLISINMISSYCESVFAGLVLLEPLFTDASSASAANKDYGYQKLLADWKDNMIQQKIEAQRTAAAFKADKERMLRSYMNLSVFARKRSDYTKRLLDSAIRKSDAVDGVYKYINCVWYYFTEVESREMPLPGSDIYEDILAARSNQFPPFAVHLNTFITSDPHQNPLFSLRKVTDISNKLLCILTATPAFVAEFISKRTELYPYMPLASPGLVLFKLIYPLIPPVLVGILPGLLKAVSIETISDFADMHLISLATIILFSYICAVFNNMSYYSEAQVDFLQEATQILNQATPESFVIHLLQIKGNRHKGWEHSFWINTGGSSGKPEQDLTLRRVSYIYTRA